MNRDQFMAIVRGLVSVALGALIVYAFAQWIGWRWVGAFALGTVADHVWCLWQLGWRPW